MNWPSVLCFFLGHDWSRAVLGRGRLHWRRRNRCGASQEASARAYLVQRSDCRT
jgi:hypothetical protein